MLLGKRQRAPIRRTTSMTEITVDLNGIEGVVKPHPSDQKGGYQKTVSDGGRRYTEGYVTTVSPRTHWRNSADFLETAPFLRACGLCKRKLRPGRDIYMYRGDTAFCSLECRQQQMSQDERKDNCSMASMKKEVASSATSGSEASSNGETLAAA